MSATPIQQMYRNMRQCYSGGSDLTESRYTNLIVFNHAFTINWDKYLNRVLIMITDLLVLVSAVKSMA